MIRSTALALLVFVGTAGLAPAQFIIVQSPPRVVNYAPPPVFYAPPVVAYSSPGAFVPAAPGVSYSYYPPTTVYSAPPGVSYSYYPPTTVYSAPPATVAVPGVVTTRSYLGFGIFRPFGVNRETYFTPLLPR